MIADLLNAADVRAERLRFIEKLKAIAHSPDKNWKGELFSRGSPSDLLRVCDELEREIAQDSDHLAAVYIPSAPLTCLLQSLLEERYRKTNRVQRPIQNHGLSAVQVAITDERLIKSLEGRWLTVGGFEDDEDVRYVVDGMFSVLNRLISGTARFNINSAKPADLGKNARVLLFGDWATGLPRAQALAEAIANEAKQNQNDRTQHLVHLGDTYYAGRKWEYEQRFLPHWPKTENSVATHWSLNGNHDMYSGGEGYFGTLLANPKFKSHLDEQGNPSSFFILENEYWQVFGLDSAFFSPELTGMNGAIDNSQVTFIETKINPSKGVILLTHHQLFSARKGEGNSEQIKKALEERGVWKYVSGWVWGHEHRSLVYNPAWAKRNHSLPFAVCLGNSGVPTEIKENEVATASIEWEFTESMRSGQKDFLKFAFASLEFSDRNPFEVKMFIFNAESKVVYTTKIVRSAP